MTFQIVIEVLEPPLHLCWNFDHLDLLQVRCRQPLWVCSFNDPCSKALIHSSLSYPLSLTNFLPSLLRCSLSTGGGSFIQLSNLGPITPNFLHFNQLSFCELTQSTAKVSFQKSTWISNSNPQVDPWAFIDIFTCHHIYLAVVLGLIINLA